MHICAYEKNPHCQHLVSRAAASWISCRLLEVTPSQVGLRSVRRRRQISDELLLFDPQLSLSTAYKLFFIFHDVSWFMQPFIQCLYKKTLHLPLRLPHGSPPSPWKTCKILLKLGCRQASSPNQKFWEQSHCWKCNIGVTASPKEQSLTNTSWIWETPVRQGRGPRTHQITKA